MNKCQHTFAAAAAFAAAISAITPSALRADNYSLAAGSSETISTNATYGIMDISGDLTIGNDKKVLATNAVNIVGGTVAISGNVAVFGNRAHGTYSLSPVVTFSPDGDGDYGKVTAQNGVPYGVSYNGASDYNNFSAKKLVLAAANEAAVASHPDGTFTFLELRNSGANFYEMENLSSLTGRVIVAGAKISLLWQGV